MAGLWRGLPWHLTRAYTRLEPSRSLALRTLTVRRYVSGASERRRCIFRVVGEDFLARPATVERRPCGIAMRSEVGPSSLAFAELSAA